MSILWLTFYIIQITFNFVSSSSSSLQLSENIEIKSLTGEPDYKSVYLTWFVGNDENATDSATGNNGFSVHYCELQTWGSHRCKTKTIKDSYDHVDNDLKQYSAVIDNLRMATKYLFHVKSTRLGEQKATARADSGGNPDLAGEKIVVPTKGFSAQATTCLPHASEIEVETGPFFGGIIMTENNDNCRIQGDSSSEQDRYVIRIDHDKCGSTVDHEMLQVKTFITVQENMGIFTHSTRRFVVMCSYQPDMLTVRASFSVPSKTDLTPTTKDNTTERESRKRSFRMVGKEALLLKKETNSNDTIDEEVDSITDGFTGSISEVHKENGNNRQINASFDRLVYESQSPRSEDSASNPAVIILLAISLVIITVFVFLVGRKLYKRRLVKS